MPFLFVPRGTLCRMLECLETCSTWNMYRDIKSGCKILQPLHVVYAFDYLSAILAHVSLRVTVRLNTNLPGFESGSTQK